MTITIHLSSCQYRIHFVVLRSAEPITGPPWDEVDRQRGTDLCSDLPEDQVVS